MLASTRGRVTSTRPYRMSLNNCCQLLQDRRAGQVLLGGYRHGQPMAVLFLDQPQFMQGGQAGQGLAGVLRPLGGKHRLQIARRRPARPGCACTASRCRHGRAAARRRGRVPACRRVRNASNQAGLLAGQIAQPAGRIARRWAETIGPLRPVKIETSSAASTAVPTG